MFENRTIPFTWILTLIITPIIFIGKEFIFGIYNDDFWFFYIITFFPTFLISIPLLLISLWLNHYFSFNHYKRISQRLILFTVVHIFFFLVLSIIQSLVINVNIFRAVLNTFYVYPYYYFVSLILYFYFSRMIKN